ncbi:mitochondrial carrier protein [Plasmodium brasilianum]|uniref:Mitochondrial carrier protein n=2 Tax=Plasmodium (Plasmodium) TaxID=418103 RepID=A0A1A8WEV1_PLAMA|nr:mitochondrial carrier protein, putative [Plasmodium malariae]KAI4834835.1 mitochondrial carrier protein [Plasmodium brasilianum]SBS90581.1 mitochondrial carrier protein [Plasmodium malariae]SCP03395.1 mitochondrial carrier protein, putative [Plasmodium malariae]
MDIQNECFSFLKKLTCFFKKYYKDNDKSTNVLNPNCNNKNNDENDRVKYRTLNIMVSSALVLCVLHPLDTIRTRKQIYRVYKNSYPYYYNNKYNLFYILRKEKIESIYRGLIASLITTGASHGLFRFIYDKLNYHFFQNFNDIHSINNNKNYSISSTCNMSRENELQNYYSNNANGPLEPYEEKEEKKKVDQIENSSFILSTSTTATFATTTAANCNNYKNDNPLSIGLSGNRHINEKDMNSNTVDNDLEIKDSKNMNYYILTSSLSSIISVLFLHPVWLIKTKIECTINLNYKFLNYKSRITSKHYKIFVQNNRMFSYKFLSNIIRMLILSDKNYRKRSRNCKKIRLLNSCILELYKNNFIYNKNIKTKKKYNCLSFKNDKKVFLNKNIKRKMVHNYLLYKYYTMSNLERKRITKNEISNLGKKFYRRYLLYSKNFLSNNKILHLFKREENKKSVCAIYRYKNYFQFVHNIYKKEKFFSFYKGFLASLLLTPHVAIQFYIYESLMYYFSYEYLNTLFIENNINISANTLCKTLPFLYGVISKYTAIIFTYPLYTIKMRQQVQMKNYGFYNVLVNIFRFEGIKSYYTGINMHLLRNCLQNGTLFFIFEYLNNAKI